MATWQAILVDVSQQDGLTAFSIVYTDGATKVLREYHPLTISDAGIQAIARAEVAHLEIGALPGKIGLPIGVPIDLLPPVPPTPDPDVVARETFLANWRTLQSYTRGVEAGLVAVDNVDLIALRVVVSKDFLPTYAGSL